MDEPINAAAGSPPSIEDVIERWWNDHFPGSVVAGVTAAWNHAFAAKEQLKQLLSQLDLNPHRGE